MKEEHRNMTYAEAVPMMVAQLNQGDFNLISTEPRPLDVQAFRAVKYFRPGVDFILVGSDVAAALDTLFAEENFVRYENHPLTTSGMVDVNHSVAARAAGHIGTIMGLDILTHVDMPINLLLGVVADDALSHAALIIQSLETAQ